MKIGIVLVTFNRLQDLKKTLSAYEVQEFLPRFVLVVDNKSTDGTDAYLAEWAAEQGAFERQVLTLPENMGGSGGFYSGMKEAMEQECDWIFVADDDAVPRPDMLKKLVEFSENEPELTNTASALCTSVYNQNHFEGIHRCRIKKSILGCMEAFVPESEYQKPWFYCDIYSFVGTMIRRSALETAGLAREDFFIYNDDYEHAVRVGKTGKIICVPDSVMDHIDNLNYEKTATWRDYYATRNAVIMHRTHFGAYAGFARAMRRLAIAISTFNGEKIRVIWTGIRDGYAEKTGKHPIYVPGWKGKQK